MELVEAQRAEAEAARAARELAKSQARSAFPTPSAGFTSSDVQARDEAARLTELGAQLIKAAKMKDPAGDPSLESLDPSLM